MNDDFDLDLSGIQQSGGTKTVNEDDIDVTGIKPDASLKRWFGSFVQRSKESVRSIARSQRLDILFGHDPYINPELMQNPMAYAEALRLREVSKRNRAINELSEEIPDLQPTEADIQMRMIDVDKRDRQEIASWWEGLERSEFLQTAPEYEGISSGMIEDITGAIGSSWLGSLSVGVNPVIGSEVIFRQMHGATSESLEKKGVPLEKAHFAGQAAAAISLPLELLGEAFKFKAFFPNTGKWVTRLLLAGEAFGGEALTEYLQQYPETGAEIWAMNPDLLAEELILHMGDAFWSLDFQKEAGYSGLIGGFAALGTAGAVQASVGSVNYLISEKQRRINKAKSQKFADLISKENPSAQDVQELIKLAGIQKNILTDIKGDNLSDIVEEVKARVMFQSEPIKSIARDQIKSTIKLHKNFTNEHAEAYMAIWDGIAHSLTESGDISSPDEFYNMWRFENESGESVTGRNVLYQSGERVVQFMGYQDLLMTGQPQPVFEIIESPDTAEIGSTLTERGLKERLIEVPEYSRAEYKSSLSPERRADLLWKEVEKGPEALQRSRQKYIKETVGIDIGPQFEKDKSYLRSTPKQEVPIQDVINNPKATETEVIAEKLKLKSQVVAGVQSGAFDGAVRFGTVDEIKSILKEGRMQASAEYGAIHAQPIMGKNDNTFAAYGSYKKHNMAIVFPKESVRKKPEAHTKEVLIDDKVNVRDLKFLIDGHEKIYTFDELEGALKQKPAEARTLYQQQLPQKAHIPVTPEEEKALIDMAFEGKVPATEKGERPDIKLTAGLPWAGKSTSLDAVADKDRVIANSDDVKKQAGYASEADKFHEESSKIAKKIVDKALAEDYHLTYDSLLSNFDLADKIINDALDQGKDVSVHFAYVDAITSRVRSLVRVFEGKSERQIPDGAIIKGHNRVLPTFMELYKKYGKNPDVHFYLKDNNVDFRNPVPIIENSVIINSKAFDNIRDIEYNKISTEDGVRYERKEKETTESLRNEEAEINQRINKLLAFKGIHERQPGQGYPLRDKREKSVTGDTRTLYQRTNIKPWPSDFPNVTNHTHVSKLKSHPKYKAGKAGDVESAIEVARDLVNIEKAKALKEKHPNAILVPVISLESGGHNKLPLELAIAISEITGLEFTHDIYQTNYVDRTHEDEIGKLLTPIAFDGNIIEGQEYILVDDAVGQGGTLSSLRHFIENNGGIVVDVTAFGSGRYASRLSVKPETIKKIETEHGREQTEKFLKDFNIAGTLESLTEKQARKILSKSLDELRAEAVKRGYSPGSEDVQGQIQRPGVTDRKLYQNEIPSIRHWIASKGGVNPNDKTWKGEFNDLKTKKGFPKNFWNENALSLDDLTATAITEGWLPPGSTDQDLFDAIESNMESPFTSDIDADLKAYNEWAWENYDGDEQAIRRDEEQVRADLNNKIRRAAENLAKRKAVEEVSKKLGIDVELTADDENYLQELSEVEYNNLFDTETTGNRGSIENLFTDDPAIIRAFQGADPSTPIHETGHLLTKILYKTRREDYLALADWAGVEQERADQGINTWSDEELEKVARGFERYIMEGKAPTMRLQPIFRKFKQWLIQIYRSVTALNVDISPKVREVFDRLVSTEEERINDPVMGVLEWLNVDNVNASIRPGSPVSYENITARAKKTVLSRVLEKRKKDKKTIAKQFRQAADELVEDMDVYHIMNDLVGLQGLDMFAIKAEYGERIVKDLNEKKRGLATENGVDPEKYSGMWGYDSVGDMINEILSSDDKKSAANEIYKRLWAEYENVLNEDHVDIYGQVIDEEIKILDELLGKETKAEKSPKSIIREKTGQVRPEDYRKLRDDLKRDESTTRQAFRQGKLEEAARLKRKQKETVSKMRRAVKDSRERTKTIKRMKSYLRMKVNTLPVDYKEQIADILNRYFVLPPKYQRIRARESLENLLDRAEAEGENVDVPRMIFRNKLPDPPSQRQVKEYTTRTGRTVKAHNANEPMSLEDIQIIAQLVDSIAYLGKTKGKLIAGNRKRDLEETVKNLVEKIFSAHKPKPEQTPWEIIDKEQKKVQAVERMKTFFLEELDQPEFIVRALDGWEDLGPVWEEIIKPIKEAWDKELVMGSDITNELKNAFDKAGADRAWANEKVEITLGPEGEEKSGNRRKEELFMIALNSGNEGNRAALKQGYGYTDAQLNTIWESLSKKEKQLCHDIWDILDSLFPMLEDVHLKHTGARLIKVEGKYFPLMFDRSLSEVAEKYSQERELKDIFASEYHMTKPEWGHRKERVGGKMPPLLSISVLQEHVQKTIHDITHQLAVRDIQKIISHPRFREAVKRTLGERTYRQLMPWLQHVARPTYEHNNSSTEWFWKHLRKTSTLVNMGFKLTTAADQWTAILLAAPEIGSMRILQGLKQFYRDPKNSIKWVHELSPQMRFRSKQFDRDLNQFGNSFDPKSIAWTEDVKDAAFWLIKLNDLAVTYPVWIGSYHKGMSKFNGDQDSAVEYADMIVRKTQSTAAPWVLSAFQRGGKTKSEAVKMVGMFYTFFATFKNQMREVHRRYGAKDINTVQLMAAYWWKVILPGSLGGALIPKLALWALFGEDDDEPEKLIKKIPKNLVGYYLGGVPILRDVVNGMMNNYGYSFTPIEEAFESAVNLGKGITNPDYWTSRKLVKGVIKTTGYIFGLPSAQINITLEGMLDLMSGETEDPSKLLFYKEDKKQRKYKR